MLRDLRTALNTNEESPQQVQANMIKHEEVLKNKIPTILKNYENLKEWSDLGQWLLKLQHVLQDHPCAYIPKKKLFCRRMAQCLSPVWNKAIHENALLIYDIVLNNLTTQKSTKQYDLINDIPLFSLGLFPFFGYSSSQCKPMVLDIFSKYYYPLGPQLIPSLPGLINSIIVGMEETNEESMKKVMHSLDQACECVGVKVFYGNLWVSIVRSSRCRLGAFKYLMKRWPKQSNLQFDTQDNELDQILSDSDKMPNKQALVLNALMASLEDEQSLIKRAALDFMCTYARIEDEVFSHNENLLLVQSCLSLFMKMDHAVVRRINNWFFGEMDLNESEKLKGTQIIQLIQQALTNILMNTEEQQNPLKIIQNWYMQHPETVELTLEFIGYTLVRYMYKKLEDQNIQKASERLVESIASNSELILESLYNQLQKQMDDKKKDLVFQTINYINFSLNELLVVQFQMKEDLNDEQEVEQFVQKTVSLRKLLSIIKSRIIEMEPENLFKLSIIDAILNLGLQTVIKIKQRDQQMLKIVGRKMEIKENIKDQIIEWCEHYVKINEYALENEVDAGTFEQLNEILYELQLQLENDHGIKYDNLPNWCLQLIKSSKSKNPRQSLSSIEIIMQIIKGEGQLMELLTLGHRYKIERISELSSLASELHLEEEQKLDCDQNYMKDIFERLWLLLDYHYLDTRVIDAIIYFSRRFPTVFTFVVETTFQTQDEAQLELAIRRYQIFCRLTNPHFRKFSHENKGVGVLTMLSYLQHENPLMRHNSKTWLMESAPFFFRILDPLLERLINAQILAQPIEQDQIIYQSKYQTEIILDTFNKIQLLLANIKEWFISYIQNAQISKTIYEKLILYPSKSKLDLSSLTYIQLLTHLLEVFIQGSTEDKQSLFARDNSRVNAICCEFFELLMQNIESTRIKFQIIKKHLLKMLQHLTILIKKCDSILQIQILNLIKNFIVSTKECEQEMKPNEKKDVMAIYASDYFIPNFLNGLKHSNVFFTKSKYLNAIVISIYTLSDMLDKHTLTERVNQIINTIMNILMNHEYNHDKPQQTRATSTVMEDDYDKFLEMQQQQLYRVSNVYQSSQYFQSSSKWKRQENFEATDILKLSGNTDIIQRNNLALMSSSSGENFEEVMNLSNSIRAIIAFYFRFKDEIKPDLDKPQSTNIQGILLDIITFNQLKYRRDKNPQISKQTISFIQFQETSQLILQMLPFIINSFLSCWRLGVQQEAWSFLCTKGCLVYEYEKFEYFTKAVNNEFHKLEEEYSDHDQIKQSILSVMTPCAYQFTSEFLSALMHLWCSQYSDQFYEKAQPSMHMYKILELAILVQIPPDDFMCAMIKTQQAVQLVNFYQKKQMHKKSIFLHNEDQAKNENHMFFFIYVYLTAQTQQTVKQQQIIKLWITTLQFTKNLLVTRHINTLCWILELFYMMSWKFSPKEVLNNSDLKKELHTQLKQVLNTLAEITTEKSKFIIINENNRYSVASNQNQGIFKLLVPFTPVMYELKKEYEEVLTGQGEKTEEQRDQFWIQRIIFDPYKQIGAQLSQEDYGRKCSLIAFKTLKRLAYVTLINTYEANKNERIIENSQQLMFPIFPLLENKNPSQFIIVEAGSEMLHSLLKHSRDQLAKEFRKQILEIFNGTDFFKCSRRTLKYWKDIIDWISEKGDLLLDHLGGNQNIFTGFAGLFTSRSAETVKKIKGFERVCFIIYSGSVDKYNSKINNLLDAIFDIIKEINSQHPAIIVLVQNRVQFHQLDNILYQDINIKAFGIVSQLCIQKNLAIINFDGQQIKNPNVLLAGLKLIELFSVLQLEEFYFYQWIFAFDYFGITIDMKSQTDVVVGIGEQVHIVTPFNFKPYISYQFPNVQSFFVNYNNKIYPDQLQQEYNQKKRMIIIKDPSVETEVEVRRQAVYLCQYLIDINQQRIEVSSSQLESLIEAEFIQLDEYIFRIS